MIDRCMWVNGVCIAIENLTRVYIYTRLMSNPSCTLGTSRLLPDRYGKEV